MIGTMIAFLIIIVVSVILSFIAIWLEPQPRRYITKPLQYDPVNSYIDAIYQQAKDDYDGE